jgi:hypothetical protein
MAQSSTYRGSERPISQRRTVDTLTLSSRAAAS